MFSKCSADSVQKTETATKKIGVENLGLLATPFDQALRALALTHDDLLSLVEIKFVRSRRKFFTVWAPNPSQSTLKASSLVHVTSLFSKIKNNQLSSTGFFVLLGRLNFQVYVLRDINKALESVSSRSREELSLKVLLTEQFLH